MNSVLLTCSLHSANCDNDHCMVINKACLQPKKVTWTKQPSWPNINPAKTADPELCMQFVNSIEQTISANQTQMVSMERG